MNTIYKNIKMLNSKIANIFVRIVNLSDFIYF